jgi:hypothetical protein
MPIDINALITATDQANIARFAQARGRVVQYLTTVTTVKIFIAASRNFGHQSSSVSILFNLIRMGCTATFTIVYENNDALRKLKVLLPIDPGNPVPITLPTPTGGTVNVNFLSFDADQPACDLALTGGYDAAVTTLTRLSATYIIELQPFNWQKDGSQNSIYIQASRTVQLLDGILNGNFNQQGFYLSDPARDNAFWARFATAVPAWATAVNLITKILDLYPVAEHPFYLLPAYGINTGSIDPIVSLFNLCCGVSYLQDQPRYMPAQKAVIVSFSPVNQPGQNNDVNLGVLNTLITNRTYGGKSGLYQPNANCIAYLTSSTLADRVKYYSGSDPNELEARINALAANEILVVQIGPVPAPIFNYTYSVANLPVVFEGQNTAALALNLGVPYIHITAPGNYDDSLFPVIPPGNVVSGQNGMVATKICSKMSEYPGNWRSPTEKLTQAKIGQYGKPGVVAQLAASYILGKYCLERVLAVDNPMIRYFTRFREYFHNERNDKLLTALIYLEGNIINP